MPLIQPLNNHILVELQREYADVVRHEADEVLQRGIAVSINYNPHHLTGMGGYRITQDVAEYKQLTDELDLLVGKVVMWSEGAEAGTIFKHEDKDYALVPFWRLVGFELPDEVDDNQTSMEVVEADKPNTEAK